MNAKEIATLAHAGQFRRDGITPYITHPEAVASVFEEGTPEWETAWLHDTIEDTDLSMEDLRLAGVDGSVMAAVLLLTHPKGMLYNEYISDLFFGYDSYPAQIARRVKLADIAANLADNPTERQRKKYATALQIIAKNI